MKKRARFEVYQNDSSNSWSWKLLNPKDQVRAFGRFYSTKADCLKSIAEVKALILKNRGQAEAAMRSLIKQFDEAGLHVYICAACRCWHVGHKS